MKRIIGLIGFLILFSFTGYSQTVKGTISFLGSELLVNPSNLEDTAVQGLSTDLDFKLIEKSNFRLGGVFNYQRPIINGDVFGSLRSSAVNIYSAGPQLSYKIGFVEPFATALFGATTFDKQIQSDAKAKFTRTYRGGVDLNFGNFVIRPFYVQYQFTEGFNINAVRQYGAGFGFRFGGSK